MKYSEIVCKLAEGWWEAMKTYDSYKNNNNIDDINKWYHFLDIRKELHNAIEDLVENSKLYREKNDIR